jgi:hypothetical protein
LASGEAVTTRVQVGLNDGTYVEIARGLNEGDMVVVEYEATTEEETFFGGAGVIIRMDQPGGGAPPSVPGGN